MKVEELKHKLAQPPAHAQVEDKDSQLEKIKDKVSKLEEEIKHQKVENAQHKPLAQAQSQVQAQSEVQAQVEDEDGVVKWWRTGCVIQGLQICQDRAPPTK